jgi:hypothetical protein
MLVSLFCICIRGRKKLTLLIKFFVECTLGCQSGHRGRASSAKLHFFAEFRSVPSFGTGSSAELGMPRNGHFLPRNNGNHFESIPRNFFGTKFRSQPYLLQDNNKKQCISILYFAYYFFRFIYIILQK